MQAGARSQLSSSFRDSALHPVEPLETVHSLSLAYFYPCVCISGSLASAMMTPHLHSRWPMGIVTHGVYTLVLLATGVNYRLPTVSFPSGCCSTQPQKGASHHSSLTSFSNRVPCSPVRTPCPHPLLPARQQSCRAQWVPIASLSQAQVTCQPQSPLFITTQGCHIGLRPCIYNIIPTKGAHHDVSTQQIRTVSFSVMENYTSDPVVFLSAFY